MKPNNVTRMLDAKGIAYEAYDLPPEKLGALEAAEILGVEPEAVYKTIVVTREGRGKPILALVPGPKEVDLKAVAKSVGEKKVHLATLREAEKITSLQAGGISPLALIQRSFDVIMDATAEERSEIYLSGGQRGMNIRMPVSDLVALTNAEFAIISR